MARGRTSHSRQAALSLRAPVSGSGAAGPDPLAPLGASWAGLPGAPAAPAATRRTRFARAGATAAACLVAGAGWLGSTGTAAAAVGDAPAADCAPGIALQLDTAPPAQVANDGSGMERWSYTICARQTVQRIQTRIARLKDPRMPAVETNLDSVTPSEALTGLHGTRSYSVPAGLAPGSYAVEVSYFTPDGRMADRAASVFRVASTPAPPPLPVAPPAPAAPPAASAPPAEAVPPATPRAEGPRKAKLRLIKRADCPTVRAGGKVRWTLRLSSVGPVAARNVALCDRLPAGLILASAPGARMKNGEVCWAFKRMPKGATRVVRITTRADGQLLTTRMLTNRAHAKAANAATVRAKANVIGVPSSIRVKAPVAG